MPLTAHDFVWTANFIIENDISSWTDGYRVHREHRGHRRPHDRVDDHAPDAWSPGWPGYSLIAARAHLGRHDAEGDRGLKNFPEHRDESGPFKLVEWEPGEFWRLEARDDYYGGAPAIDEIVFRVYNSDEAVMQALIKGEIDYTRSPPRGCTRRVKDKPNIEAVVTSAEAFHQLSFNLVGRSRTSTAHPAVLGPGRA